MGRTRSTLERGTVLERVAPRRWIRGKRIASLLAAILTAPLVLMYRGTAALFPDRRDDVFQGYSQLISLVPGYTGVFVRCAFYRRTLKACADNFHVGFGTLFSTPDVSVGQNVYIGARCMIAHSVIHDDVMIGSNVDVIAGRHTHDFHDLNVPMRLQGGRYETVSIARDAWLGNGSTVLADVGEQAIVAAGSVVVKSVDPRSIVGGNPARQIGVRSAPSRAGSINPPRDLHDDGEFVSSQ